MAEPAHDQKRSIPAGGEIEVPNGKATEAKPKWIRKIEETMEACRKAKVPYILVGVAPNGKIIGGYKGAIPVLEETMLALAGQLNGEMQRKRINAPLLGTDGNPISSGQKEGP